MKQDVKQATAYKIQEFIQRKFLFLIILFVNMGSFVCLLGMKIDNEHGIIILIPLTYLIICLFVNYNKDIVGINSGIILALYLFKMSIMPVIFAAGNFYTDTKYELYINHWNWACISSVLEIVCVVISIKIWQRFFRRQICKNFIYKIYNHEFIKLVILLFIVVLAITFFINPEMTALFHFAWEKEKTFALGENGGAVYYLSKKFIDVLRPLFTFYMYYIFHRKSMPRVIRVLGILGVLSSCLIWSDNRIIVIITALTILINLLLSGKGIIISFIKPLCVIGTFAMTFLILATTSSATSLSGTVRALDRYFGGYMIMAMDGGVYLKNPLKVFLSDIWNGSVLLTGIFGSRVDSTAILNATVNAEARGSFFQFFMQSQKMFGVFAFVPVLLIIGFIIYMDYKAQSVQSELYKLIYSYLGISSSIYIIMYSMTMQVNFIIYDAVWLLLILYLDKKKLLKRSV